MTDPRKRRAVRDPLSPFERNEKCWCGSGRKYKRCHGDHDNAGVLGELPDDHDDVIYIAPRVAISRSALDQGRVEVPITVQTPTPQATPFVVGDAVAMLASLSFDGPSTPLPELGALRFAVMDSEGLTNADAIRSGEQDQRIAEAFSDLAYNATQIARLTIDSLAEARRREVPPVVLSADMNNPTSLIGQTMLWADHYLVADGLALTATPGSDDPASWRDPIAELIELRPLVESGLVVPAVHELALAVVSAEAGVDALTAAELQSEEYVSWLVEQVIVHGPSAREAVFIDVIDDYPHDGEFYLHARADTPQALQDGEQLEVGGQLLRPLDPAFDYQPWIRTVRHQVAARLTKELTVDLAASATLGADLVAGSPFRARALARRATTPPKMARDFSAMVWADVPNLPNASPETLARIAASEERVADLRNTVASAMAAGRSDEGITLAAATELSSELSRAAASVDRKLRAAADRGLIPGALAAGSVLVAGTMAPPLVAGAFLAGAATGYGPLKDAIDVRHSAAFAFWMARARG